ncbi:MAG: hypothetical protein HJJLKODD_01133 [Phycisphaerae bacterium]|nr:hypothetical protein [Phycisphaerae bacterium]
MGNSFLDFLKHRGLLRQRRSAEGDNDLEFREVLGAIALRHGMLTPEQVDEVLLMADQQRPFHLIALELGFLNEQQINRLQKCQLLEEALQIGVGAILAEQLEPQVMLRELNAYFESADTQGIAGE